MSTLESMADLIRSSQKITVITGAGMSTESGIPDFRSSQGLYNEAAGKGVPMEEVLSASFFEKYPKTFYRIYNEKLLYPNAQPNSGHTFLKKLEDSGHDVTVITQNIDGLHQKAGSTRVLELHGNANKVVTGSGRIVPLSETVTNDEGISADGEWARPAITLYGEALDGDILKNSIQAIRKADMLLVMGTSLNVYPAAGLIYDYKGKKSGLVNRGSTPMDAYFTFVFDGAISDWVEKMTCHLEN